MLRSPLIYLTFITVFVKLSSSFNNNTLLLLVSFDGFRYDYVERNLSNTLVQLRMNSSYPPYMLSVFPSKTFPNHFSIATGLYSEVHGVLDNQMYDKSTNKSLKYGYDLFHYNENIVPLWILNERGGDGRRSGCMMYPSCDFKYQDTLPTYHIPYNESVKWQSRIDTLLSWFGDPDTPINLGMAYFEQPDETCHDYGPESEEVNREIIHVDQIVQYLLNKAEQIELLKRLNIVFLSDHGGQAVKVPENIIDLDKYINKSWYIKDGIPPVHQIYPLEGKEAEVLEALKSARAKGGNFSAYTHNEMLDRWHYKNCARTPPILLTADLGFLFSTEKHKTDSPSAIIGDHGYDPIYASMRAFFMATGPLFKKNHTIEPFENINIYPLAAHVLGLTLPELKPNGSLRYLQDILVVNTFFNEVDGTLYIGLIIGAIVLLSVIGWLIKHRVVKLKDKSINTSRASYKVLLEGTDEERLHETQEMLSSDCEEEIPT